MEDQQQTQDQETRPDALEAFLQLSKKIDNNLDYLILRLATSASINDFIKK